MTEKIVAKHQISYYRAGLSGARLKQCYALAPARIRQYLAAEINYIISLIRPGDSVLELGCGYGRIIKKIAAFTDNVTGIDTANDSLELAKSLAGEFRQLCQLQGLTPDIVEIDNSNIMCLITRPDNHGSTIENLAKV